MVRVIVFAGLLLGFTARSAYAAITLESFTATPANATIEIDWATGTEFNTAGFYVGRSTSVKGPFTHIPNNYTDDPSGFVLATGGIAPASYNLVDQNVQKGILYYYRLEEIDNQNHPTFYDPVTAGIDLVAATLTPTPTDTPKPHASVQILTPTPRASGLDPSSFVRSTPVPTDAPAQSPQPATQPPASPTASSDNSAINGSAPFEQPPVPPTASSTRAIQQSNVPQLAQLPPSAPSPASNAGTLVAMAPMVVGASDNTQAPASASADGGLLAVSFILALILLLGGLYALRRQTQR